MMYSIVIPTYNEDKNIQLLIERIDQAFYMHQLSYEVLIVDDHSTDNTIRIVKKLEETYPVKLIMKEGRRGKSYSLLQGFKEARGEYIGMIDADLQYPPEFMPYMFAKAQEGADVVIAKRLQPETKVYRQIMSKIFQFVFGRVLHGLPVDVQSGMKIFKKEIIERIDLSPTSWTFDLEFLIKSRDAGYTISQYDIPFKKRHSGKSHVNPIKTSLEIGMNALKLKLKPSDVIKFHRKKQQDVGKGFSYRQEDFVHFSELPFEETAFFQITRDQKMDLVLIALIITLSAILNWKVTLIAILGGITAYYFLDLMLNFSLIFISLFHKKENNVRDDTVKDFPTYTILCPLYKETSVLPQFLTAIEKLAYPKEKLQVLLLLEEDDKDSIQAVEAYDLPSYVSAVIVPDSRPKTKPKACNYGLIHAKGDFIVIYDAEDVPETDQLTKVVNMFAQSPSEVVCVQAKLNFYNTTQNLLTRFFTAEYALWFDLILPGLQRINAPIPLGGTSNHFKTKTLRELGGWDSFNVTEDCDLGMRIARKGYKTVIVESTTFEEANSNLMNWVGQRSRWIKGYLQTYLVQSRSATEIKHSFRFPFFLHFTVGGKILSLFINPLMWFLTIAYFVLRTQVGPTIEELFPPQIYYLGVLSLIFGNFLYMYYYMIGLLKREQYGLIKFAFFIPFYWLIMSIAAIKGVVEMITKPHYWAKTKHGLHLSDEERQNQRRIVDILEVPYISILPRL